MYNVTSNREAATMLHEYRTPTLKVVRYINHNLEPAVHVAAEHIIEQSQFQIFINSINSKVCN